MEFQLLRCWHQQCPHTFYTFTDLCNHHLAAHERPHKAGPVEPWTPPVRLTRWEPPIRGLLTIQQSYTNGTVMEEPTP